MRRISALGIEINPTNLHEIASFIAENDRNRPAYICLPDTSVAASAYNDNKLFQVLQQALLVLPDGLPLVMVLRIKGFKNATTISGYWLIKELIKTNLSHYFYGATENTCRMLTERLKAEVPTCRIVGFNSPPFEDLQNIEENNAIREDIARINLLRPDIIWIGISSPKQDYLMYHHYRLLEHGIMIGVGGVFDYLAGTHKISPEWIKKAGFRWLFRLLQDPGRLWNKYYRSFAFVIKYMIAKFLHKTGIRTRYGMSSGYRSKTQ
jgi:N-acetylglucosaminyldiphosphoundecaprenol N-acetyl-beta-D-mannosaminyltransferase